MRGEDGLGKKQKRFVSYFSSCPSKPFYELACSKVLGVEVELKEYMCVEVKHHKNVGEKIEEWQKSGWRLHTYQVTGRDIWINHYLLFERGE
jgi:hypothetical protein